MRETFSFLLYLIVLKFISFFIKNFLKSCLILENSKRRNVSTLRISLGQMKFNILLIIDLKINA